MTRPMTRQDHIDPQVSEVRPCGAAMIHQRGTDMMVIFTNGEWVCSSGHVSDYDKLPTLRRPELDVKLWVKEHHERIARELPVKACPQHAADAKWTNWGHEGHIWFEEMNSIGVMTICLPQTVDRPGGDMWTPYYG